MIPDVTHQEMEQIVRRHLPDAPITVESINPAYRSWRMGVTTPYGEIEFVWGPLTGFGASDFRLQSDNPFTPYDQAFDSVDEAESFLKNYLENPC